MSIYIVSSLFSLGLFFFISEHSESKDVNSFHYHLNCKYFFSTHLLFLLKFLVFLYYVNFCIILCLYFTYSCFQYWVSRYIISLTHAGFRGFLLCFVFGRCLFCFSFALILISILDKKIIYLVFLPDKKFMCWYHIIISYTFSNISN